MSFFDPSAVKEDKSFGALPAGRYRVIVDNLEMKRNSKDTGDLIKVTYKVLAGEHKGRLIWGYFNYRHVNPQAQNIGHGQLKRFLAAVGQTEALADEAAFYRAAKDKVLVIDLVEKEDDKNDIKGWYPDASAARPAQSVAQGYSDPGF